MINNSLANFSFILFAFLTNQNIEEKTNEKMSTYS